MKAAFGDIAELKGRYPVFDLDSYPNAVMLDKLAAKAGTISTALASAGYPTPASSPASWTITFADVPDVDDTVEGGGKTYTFKDTPASENDVARGSTAVEAALNLYGAIEGHRYGTYHADTTKNLYMGADVSAGVVTMYCRRMGSTGANESVAATGSHPTLAVLSTGGNEYELLTDLNLALTARSLLAGQSIGKGSGKANRSLLDDLESEIEQALAFIEDGGAIRSTSGGTLALPALSPHVDEDA